MSCSLQSPSASALPPRSGTCRFHTSTVYTLHAFYASILRLSHETLLENAPALLAPIVGVSVSILESQIGPRVSVRPRV